MSGAGPVIAELAIADAPEAWRRLGFAVAADAVRVGTVRLRLLGPDAGEGIVGWALDGASAALDGLPALTAGDAQDAAAAPAPPQPNGCTLIDHVVVLTPSLERTTAALEAAGIAMRRVREAGTPEQPLRQGFFRLGEVILEVVEAAAAGIAAGAPARFWGITFVTERLDELAARLGDDLGATHDAVQPGRRIASVRRSAGLALPVAFITPDPRRAGR